MSGGATKEQRARWTRANPDYMREYHQARRRDLRQWIVALKESQSCTDCGGSFPAAAMDYDHVRGTKKATVQSLVARCCCKETILKEIAKCELRCSNCHRIRHHGGYATEVGGI